MFLQFLLILAAFVLGFLADFAHDFVHDVRTHPRELGRIMRDVRKSKVGLSIILGAFIVLFILA